MSDDGTQPEGDAQTVSESGDTINVSTAKVTRVTVRLKRQVTRLNCAKIRFNTDSAIFLPSGLAVLKAVLLHLEQNEGQKVLIASHTDTAGSKESNQELSEARSQNVLYVITGQRRPWIDHNERDNSHKNQDVRDILKWAARLHGWPCDPGPSSNDPLDQKVKDAVVEFKKGFGVKFTQNHTPGNHNDEVDGGFWNRVVNLYWYVLAESLGKTHPSELKEYTDRIVWVDDEVKSVGLGEEALLVQTKDGQDEAENRRTEFLFFQGPFTPIRPAGEEGDQYLRDIYKPGRFAWKDLDCPEPEFFGEKIPKGNVIFVIDCSGSMANADQNGGLRPDRIGLAKRSLNLAIDALDEASMFTVLAFNRVTLKSFREAGDYAAAKPKMVEASAENKDRATAWVNRLRAQNDTHTADALKAAFQTIDGLAGQPTTVKFLSDGAPTPRRGMSGGGERTKIREEVKGWNKGWKLDTVGFYADGQDPGALEEFLKGLADENGGAYTPVVVSAPAGAR